MTAYGEIADPRLEKGREIFPYKKEQNKTVVIQAGENRYTNGVWGYQDIDSLNTDQMFAGSLTYTINSSEPENIIPHLFKGFDDSFAGSRREIRVQNLLSLGD